MSHLDSKPDRASRSRWRSAVSAGDNILWYKTVSSANSLTRSDAIRQVVYVNQEQHGAKDVTLRHTRGNCCPIA